ncbi:MAG: hypothetical protein SGI92_29380 [Bryobacteraceae bacterium]|nr:hypothetical protein [Bryobacteraceae bacterium]
MPRSTCCRDQSGQLVTIAEALLRRQRERRFIGACVECGGRVRAHAEAVNGMAAHFEHIEGYERCSLSAPHR